MVLFKVNIVLYQCYKQVKICKQKVFFFFLKLLSVFFIPLYYFVDTDIMIMIKIKN